MWDILLGGSESMKTWTKILYWRYSLSTTILSIWRPFSPSTFRPFYMKRINWITNKHHLLSRAGEKQLVVIFTFSQNTERKHLSTRKLQYRGPHSLVSCHESIVHYTIWSQWIISISKSPLHEPLSQVKSVQTEFIEMRSASDITTDITKKALH